MSFCVDSAAAVWKVGLWWHWRRALRWPGLWGALQGSVCGLLIGQDCWAFSDLSVPSHTIYTKFCSQISFLEISIQSPDEQSPHSVGSPSGLLIAAHMLMQLTSNLHLVLIWGWVPMRQERLCSKWHHLAVTGAEIWATSAHYILILKSPRKTKQNKNGIRFVSQREEIV